MLLPGRLRHEDGPGPAAHLAARRPQRGAVGRLGAALRRAAELRLPRRSSASYQVCVAAGAGGLRRGPARWSSACSRWRVAAVFIVGAGRLQAACSPTPASSTWASSPLGIGLGGRRRLRRAAARRQPLADQGDALPGRRQHPRPPTARKSTARRPRRCGATLPVSGVLWLAGFLAITGSPPFGPFLSEFTILKARARPAAAHSWPPCLLWRCSAVVFVGMARPVLADGPGPSRRARCRHRPARRRAAAAALRPASLAAWCCCSGVYVPPPLTRRCCAQAARVAGRAS